MAKIDTANEIVAEFPDKGFDAEKLKEENTQEELDQLQADLRAEASAPTSSSEGAEGSNDSEPPVAKTSTEAPEKKKYKLADPATSYQEAGFTLIGKQEKELPENPSPFLQGYIRSGYIVEVK